MAALTTKRREGEVEKSATTLITRVLGHWMTAVRQWGGWWHPTRGDAASRKCGDIRWKSRKQNRTWQRLKLDSSFQCSYSQRPFSAGLKTHYKVKGISVDWGQESLTKEFYSFGRINSVGPVLLFISIGTLSKSHRCQEQDFFFNKMETMIITKLYWRDKRNKSCSSISYVVNLLFHIKLFHYRNELPWKQTFGSYFAQLQRFILLFLWDLFWNSKSLCVQPLLRSLFHVLAQDGALFLDVKFIFTRGEELLEVHCVALCQYACILQNHQDTGYLYKTVTDEEGDGIRSFSSSLS